MASNLWKLLLLTLVLTGLTSVTAYNSSAANSSSIVVGNITWIIGSCSYKAINCHPEANCEEIHDNTTDLNFFRCFCPPGLSGDGYTNGTGCQMEYTRCIFTLDCHQYATCNATSYCECNPGFIGDGYRWCNDTDECLSSPCDINADCLNRPGDFSCVCHFQNNYYGDGFQCIHRCFSNLDCHPYAICNQSDCVCTPGFNGTGLDCTDVDECQLSPCLGAGTICVNIPGSYRCDCEKGYIKSKDGTNCERAPKDCEEVRSRWPSSSDGMYTIDPDFTGPADLITVYCDMRGDYAVTEVVVSQTPRNASGAQLIDYKADDITLQALISNSFFCQQSVSLSCSARFLFDPNFYWKDSFGNSHTSWSGASEEGKCACGEVRSCDVCYCGNRKKTSDAGTFVDKQKLPVTFINWGTDSDSTFVIGNFRCAQRIFDISQDCSNLPSNGPLYITLNGALASPVLVMCDVTSYRHVTVIEMQAKISFVQPLNNSEVTVDYVQGLENVEKIINGSTFCVQSVNYRCKNSPINFNQTYVRVTSQRRQLTYFPGANGVANSCACGATASCDDTSFSCNCDAGGNIWRQDFGDIIDKDDLPIVGVVANAGFGREAEFTISTIRCAAKQFGIQPNCEKLRKTSGFVPITSTYFIDPDGPGVETGNVAPFLVQCVFQAIPAQGITVIHHGNENAFEVSGNVSIAYLQISSLQLTKLKLRSTYCSQEIEISCSRFSLTWNSSAAFWSTFDGNKFRLDQTLTTCAGGGCKCDGNSTNGKDSGQLTDLNKLPVTFIDFGGLLQQLNTSWSSAQVRISSLKCFETFPTCNEINAFVQSGKGVEGEATSVAGYYTIDMDGAGEVAAIEVECSFPNTIVDTDTKTGSIVPNGTQPVSKCFDIVYTDRNGTIITPQQLLLLRDKSSNCFQELTLSCQYARAYHKVNFTTCDGVHQMGWAGSSGEDSCACGVGGYCDGNRTNKCNCDMEDGQLRTDGGILIKSNQLPVCQVCLSVDGIPGNTSPLIPFRRLQFQLSGLICHPGSAKGIQKSCQDVRAQVRDLKADTLQIVYMVPSQPIPVACRLLTNPAIGQLEIFPSENTYVIPPTRNVSLTITYFAINITTIYQLMQTHVYCSQRIYIFCLSEGVNITLGGDYGWTSIQGDLQYNWQALRAEEIPDSVCSQHPEQCLQCGKPVGFAVHEKSKLPIIGLTLPRIGSVTILVDDIKCTDVFKSCYQIMASGDQRPVVPQTTQYVIDSDGAGGVEPFQVNCNFWKTQNCAMTEVRVQDVLQSGVRVENVLQPGGKSTSVTYNYASEAQIEELKNVSPYCFQAVEFECVNTKLINSASPAHSYYTLQHQPSFSFGTDNDTDVIGCPCSLTGTCEEGVTCHCDTASDSVSRDWGIVSRKDKLPINSVAIGGQTTSRAYGVMTVGSAFCGNCINRYPRDCQEAIEWGQRYGVNYRRSGEFYINPSPGVLQAFPVFCEMNLTSTVGITRIHSSTLPRTPSAVNSSSSHGYFASTQAYRALIQISRFCVQPVKYECYKAKLLGGGAFWRSNNNVPRYVWGTNITGSCACGVQSLCGGLDSKTGQRSRKCNCDAFDEKWRVDAGLLTDKSILPVTSLNLVQLVNNASSYVMVTIGDLYCSQNPIEFNECATGIHDCNEHAICTDKTDGYTCTCKKGWEGKNKLSTSNTPQANGRECPDDNECSFGPCPFNADCINLPGTYNCTCKEGWRQTGPKTCVDIDECLEGIAKCDKNAYCINQQGTFKCVCTRSYRGSGNAGDCHEVGVCKIFGDPHTLSFDDRWNDFQGITSCAYVASQDGCSGGTPSFRVIIQPWQQNPPVPGVGVYTWIKQVKIEIPGHVIMLRQGRVMTVDGIAVHGFTAPGYLLLDNGRQVILQTSSGLEVYWDGEEDLEIVHPKTLVPSLCGLCGNWNSNPDDDWTVGPSCKELAGRVTNNYQVFGNSWVDPDYLSTNPQCTPDCQSQPPEDVCYSPVQVVNDYCDGVFNESRSPFSACLKLMDRSLLTGMRKSCVFDLCHIKTDITKTLCSLAQSVAIDCQLNFLFPLTKWRTPTFCPPKCSGNMTYMVCGPDPNNPTQPERTCLHVREANLGRPDKVVGCSDGCFCPIPTVKEGDKCVDPNDCGCMFQGSYIPLGETNTAVGCVQTVKCKTGGVLEEVLLQCGPNSSCRLENEVVGCHCNPGLMGDGVTCVPDPCYNVTCPDPGMECVQGVCQCMMGYIGDCNKCVDIDECKSQIDTCDREQEDCINTPGGYNCICKPGYMRVGDVCQDVDECIYESLATCPENSMCVNKPGKYSCGCCIGYTMSTDGFCIVNNEEMSLYRGSGSGCCICTTPACGTAGRVCGSDGRTYDSLRALVVQSCMNETRVHPLYAGACKDTCEGVQCSRPFSDCRATKGKAECVCPKCIVNDNIPVWLSVCGSDKRVYRTVCELQAKACETNNKQLIVMSSMSYCTGTGHSTGLYNTTAWSECNVDCGIGEAIRTVVSLDNSSIQYNMTAVCYKHCEESGPCDSFTCAGPGEICVDVKTEPHCQCPSCEGETRRPVCGALLNRVDTYDNECQLRVQACLTRHNYYILDNVSCEAAPITCNVMQNFVSLVDDEGCGNPAPFDLGKCGGGCGRLPDKCCYKSSMITSVIVLDCPDGRKKEKEVEVIKACACIPPEEVARREGPNAVNFDDRDGHKTVSAHH